MADAGSRSTSTTVEVAESSATKGRLSVEVAGLESQESRWLTRIASRIKVRCIGPLAGNRDRSELRSRESNSSVGQQFVYLTLPDIRRGVKLNRFLPGR